MDRSPSLARQCLAEMIGTFLLVFFGCGCVHVAVLTGALADLWEVAVIWGVGVSLAIYAAGAISGAHLNPAVTIAFAAFRKFPLRRILPYIAAQFVGAILAAAVLYGLFSGVLAHFESALGLVRGGPGSELSAMVYGEYFPNPAIAKALAWGPETLTTVQAMLGEGIGTALLAFFIFAVTDAGRRDGASRWLAPILIGLAISILISIVAPLTQAGLNPARDFGPRLFAWFAGWGSVAIPGPRGGFFTVYILAPVVGALVGAGAYQLLLRSSLPRDADARAATE
jgi:glycerol uptake facilitator protein